MDTYQVNFLAKNWVQIIIKAKDKEEAIVKAQEIISKAEFKDKRIDIVDRSETFVGIFNESVLEQLGN